MNASEILAEIANETRVVGGQLHTADASVICDADDWQSLCEQVAALEAKIEAMRVRVIGVDADPAEGQACTLVGVSRYAVVHADGWRSLGMQWPRKQGDGWLPMPEDAK